MGSQLFFDSGFKVVLCLLVVAEVSEELDLSNCQMALGMQSGMIHNQALSASSSIDPPNLGPSNARVRLELAGGAWCPKQQISKDVYEFLQIDLGKLHVITMVETQGRFGNGQGQEYTEQYKLEYQREPDGLWFHYKNRRGQEASMEKYIIGKFADYSKNKYPPPACSVFQGNTNTYIAEMREVQPPIIATRIRFIPYSNHPKTVCLRVELYGCLWEDGAVSYSMQQGDRRNSELDFSDMVYDGKITNNRYLSDDEKIISNIYLTNGLGQLMDSEEGQANFRLDPQGLGRKGYEWVGWKNESFPSSAVDIIFKFDAVRNFSSVDIHCNNMFSKEVRIFSMAKIHFSLDGQDFSTSYVEYPYLRDNLIEYARTVRIPLEQNIGRFVKVQLFFDAKWILISEVHFVSEYAEGFPAEEDQLDTTNWSESVSDRVELMEGRTSPAVITNEALELFSRRHESHHESEAVANETGKSPTGESGRMLVASNRANGLDGESIVIIVTVVGVVIVLVLCSLVLVYFWKRRRYGCSADPCFKGKSSKSTPILMNSTLPSFSQTSTTIYPISSSGHENSYRLSYSAPHYNQVTDDLLCSSTQLDPLISSTTLISPYATTNILSLGRKRRSCCLEPGNSSTVNMPLKEIPRETLKYLQTLGDGKFGEVYLCELDFCNPYNSLSAMPKTLTKNNGRKLKLVAVKVLAPAASQQSRVNFESELQLMSQISDPNIVDLVGVCIKDKPHCMIFEYLQFGDLKRFLLQQHDSQDAAEKSVCQDNSDILSHGCLIYMATQIASGMKFLESINLVHRDLAARNCLVGNNFIVKIADLGTSHNLYERDYCFMTSGELLPVRWMAWESVLQEKYSNKSDVWSFGVTMWEILSFAQKSPYESLTDEQVLENCKNINLNNELHIVLEQPSNCPREVYDLICHCWSRNEADRPSFREIHMFLQRKNTGYDPLEERCAAEMILV